MIVKELRESRCIASAVFMEYTQARVYSPQNYFCFFEGDDRHYYLTRIYSYTGIEINEVSSYVCEGRENLFRLAELVLKDTSSTKKYKVLFFCDFDYDEQKKDIEHLYQTPVYSIENFYTTPKAFEAFLAGHFGLALHNEISQKLNSHYLARLNEYRVFMESVETKLALSLERGVHLNNLKIKRLIMVDSIDSELRFCGKYLEDFYETEKLDELTFSQIECDNKKQKLNHAVYGFRHRGKYEFEFFVMMLYKLNNYIHSNPEIKSACRRSYLGSSPLNLLTLTTYAETPNCLKEFLEKYRCIPTATSVIV